MAVNEVSPTDEFVKGLWRDNPVFAQVLGMCPALAVSNTALNALTMGLATTFVLLMSGLSISTLRNFIPREARIVSFICIIASFVTGPGSTTLPILIYSRVKLGLRPDINALATIIILIVAIGVLVAGYIMLRQQRQRALDLQMTAEKT